MNVFDRLGALCYYMYWFIGGLLFVYGGFFAAGVTASALALLNLVFALLFLPETHIPSEWKDQPEIKLGRVERLF